MRYYLLFLFGLVQIPLSSAQEISGSILMDSLVNQLKSKNFFAYRATHQQKYFDGEDTVRTDWFSIKLQKEPTDSILNFFLEMDHPKESRIYDGDKLILKWPMEELVQVFPIGSTNKNFFTNNIRRQLIPRFLYEPEPFQAYREKGNLTEFAEVEKDGKTYYKLHFDLPVDEEITLLQRIIYINPTTYLPEAIEGYAEYMGLQKEWYLLEIKYEKTSAKKENWAELTDLTDYRIEYPDLKEKPREPSLSVGSPISEITTRKLNGEEYLLSFSPTDTSLYLVDFWYVGCAPCIKAMPELEKLNQKFKTAGLKIVGLNPVDQERADLVNQFKERLKVNYDLLFVSKEIPELWQVKTYPSLYLIKGGKNVYSKVGYREGDAIALEKEITSHLSDK